MFSSILGFGHLQSASSCWLFFDFLVVQFLILVFVRDVASGTATVTFKLGEALEDQQLGCLWQDNDILSINLNGDISYLSEASTQPIRILRVRHFHLSRTSLGLFLVLLGVHPLRFFEPRLMLGPKANPSS